MKETFRKFPFKSEIKTENCDQTSQKKPLFLDVGNDEIRLLDF